MYKKQNIFLKKKILIYGMGKSGLSTYNFLKKKSEVYVFDDKKINISNQINKKKILNFKQLKSKIFDRIVLSPGIDINKCKLSKFLKKNYIKIYTDLDIFCNFYSNKKITITGTNGKSTSSKILFDVLKDQKFDVRLVGNIGNPILFEKKIAKKTIFVVEASSYQLDYSKIFKSEYAVILNISPDHLERHKTFKNYLKAKFKLIKGQNKTGLAFVDKDNKILIKKINQNRIKSKIIRVNKKIDKKIFKRIKNPYFLTDSNKQNLAFVISIANKLNLNKNKMINSLKNFKGLNYRQQIIYQSEKLDIINDSKATSFSSSMSLLKSLKNVFWILGGIPKKGDKFLLTKKSSSHLRAYIFGKNCKKFENEVRKKIYFKSFSNLKSAVDQIFLDLKKINIWKKKIILFSPSAASFDTFKNFEERGKYFNELIKNRVNAK
tara:strand:+ start:1070 stop:2374 length:1305 start_codon:yes stop_codon:yes gene_type:complete